VRPLVIFHSNGPMGHCDDGFTAAWVVSTVLGHDGADYYPGEYDKEPPDVAGRDVIMVDFSYKRQVLEGMLKACRSLLVLDHHKTAAEDLAFLPAPLAPWSSGHRFHIPSRVTPGAALFDMNRSGAGITWDFFHPGKPRPDFVNYIEDRDLWRKQLPGGDEFTIAVRSYPKDFPTWDTLVVIGPEELIPEGRSLLRYYRARVEEFKRAAYRATMPFFQTDNGGPVRGNKIDIPCMVVNCPYFAASEVAGEIAEGMPFGACYFEKGPGQWQYSLRSRAESGVDVSAIAKQFGGGGHAGAAGFTVSEPVHTKV